MSTLNTRTLRRGPLWFARNCFLQCVLEVLVPRVAALWLPTCLWLVTATLTCAPHHPHEWPVGLCRGAKFQYFNPRNHGPCLLDPPVTCSCRPWLNIPRAVHPYIFTDTNLISFSIFFYSVGHFSPSQPHHCCRHRASCYQSAL